MKRPAPSNGSVPPIWETAAEALGDTITAPDGTIRSPLPAAGPPRVLARTLVAPARDETQMLPTVVVARDAGAPGEADLVRLRTLGEGGMGRVELARQRSLERDVAIKSLPAETDAAAAASLLREARITGALEHPNIVPVHALALNDAGQPVLVMKRVEGVAWRALIHDPEHPAWQSARHDRIGRHVEILQQVCNAVHFAHSRRVVHRDVKPDNVMIGAFGEVYLLDWGIALRLDSPEDVASKALVGTPAYLAPEMLDGRETVGPWTDVYLLGASLHEALTGRPRHEGRTIRDVLRAAHESAPVEYEASVPWELGAICNRATSADPGARFASALEMRDALTDFLRHRGSVELGEEASRRLDELDAAVAAGCDEEAHRLSAECRFGFQQALRAWPENAAARAGMTAYLERAFALEVARRNHAAAGALLAEMPERRAVLEAQLEALGRELEAEARAQADLTRLRHEGSFAISLRQRVVVQFGLVASLAVAGVLVLALEGRGVALFTLRNVACAQAVVIVVFLAALALGRRRLLANRVGRQYAVVITADMAACLAATIIGLAAGIPVATVTALCFVMCALTCVFAAVVFAQRFIELALALVAGAIGCVVFPDQVALVHIGVAVMSGLVTLRLRADADAA
jgi:eukaryotic-like serine/threonine-protein kinase